MEILIVVDYQNDFVNGALGFENADKIDVSIAETIEKAYKNGAKVIVTKDTHKENYLSTQEGKKLPVKHCIKGSNGWELFGKTGQTSKNKDIVFIEKNTFGADKLPDILKSFGSADKIFICGVITNICVLSNAVIAKTACPEAEINIIEPLCLSNDIELHNKAIDVMKSLQMNIVDKY